jgi:hypothetical protein
MLGVLVALPPNPRDLPPCGQRQVAGAGGWRSTSTPPCTCLRHRLSAQVASQHCPILRSSTFSIPCGSLLCTNFSHFQERQYTRSASHCDQSQDSFSFKLVDQLTSSDKVRIPSLGIPEKMDSDSPSLAIVVTPADAAIFLMNESV